MDPRDYQVGGNRAGTAGKRGDGQGCGSAFRIADSQNGIDGGRFHNCHTYDLGDSRSAAGYGIGKILTVQGQDQLSGFGDTDLEQHLIGADLGQTEGVGTGPGNAGTAIGAVLRETDICARCHSRGIVRRHQRIKICKSQNTPGGPSLTHGPLRTDRSGYTGRALRTDRSGFANRSLRTDRPGFTDGPLRTGRPGYTGRALRTDRPGFTNRSLRTGGAGFTDGSLRTDRPGFTHGSLRTGGSGYAGRSLGADSTLWANRSLRSCFADGSLRSDRPLKTGRSLRAGRSLWA